ncbi:hypothetical protein NDU88_008123 [Pleurodeles waltl]|uniref:Uncharacterized protein n=1 Tax=Pleurodeles waltl TaxID=8319 RepID=A0AAV7SUC6_PLEWA|nr:hypothetical protein NDU88_008123 [Pleurodeles waltl]
MTPNGSTHNASRQTAALCSAGERKDCVHNTQPSTMPRRWLGDPSCKDTGDSPGSDGCSHHIHKHRALPSGSVEGGTLVSDDDDGDDDDGYDDSEDGDDDDGVNDGDNDDGDDDGDDDDGDDDSEDGDDDYC